MVDGDEGVPLGEGLVGGEPLQVGDAVQPCSSSKRRAPGRALLVAPVEHLAAAGERRDVAGGSPGGSTRRWHGTHLGEAIDGLVARLAEADQIQAVVIELEPGVLGDLGEGFVDRALESGRAP